MSQETPSDTVFIRKLTEITEANLSDEHFGVKELEEQSGLSHSQIHRKLHDITNQSASQFIREIRLKKGKELLQQDLLTVAEIAYKVGFGSPSYFNKCFHDYFGYPPGDFKNHKSEKDEASEIILTPSFETRKLPTKRFLLIALGIFVIIIFAFFSHKYLNNKTESTVKSIAVRPLRNLSDDSSNQHLADGIMYDILDRLSHIHNFEVKSSISTDTYDSPQITIKEIAKDLGVDYVLEGSLLTVGENIKLYVHLFDAKDGTRTWSDNYNGDLSDIFDFISEVSEQITKELQAVISPEESEFLDKRYTTNSEAYNLYLEGRFYWHLRGKNNVRNSIKYYKQALAIDSKFSLAYTGLADAYFYLAWFQLEPKKETAKKSKEFALKALAIDNNLAEAHATLGEINAFIEYNWETAEAQFKRAIEINPNYATAHHWYSTYLEALGRKDEARKHINRAIELEPHAIPLRYISFFFYLKEGRYNKALDEVDKMYSIDKDERQLSIRKFNIYLKQGEGLKAFNEYKKLLIIKHPETNGEILDSIYAETGIEGIVRYRIEIESKEANLYTGVRFARYYAILNEKNSALDHLERAFKNDVSWLSTIKYDIHFEDFHTEPRFIALLEKMNLGGY